MKKPRFRIILLGFAGVCWLLGGPAFAQVSSYAFVNDDGSLRIKGRTYRLHGVYIPVTAPSCRTFERPVPCGSRAALALDFKIQGFVRCETRDRNDDGTVSAYCTTDGEDLVNQQQILQRQREQQLQSFRRELDQWRARHQNLRP
jgi:endonuclease YncB( thermonuclease family)